MNCPMCFPAEEDTLIPITEVNTEYYLSVLTKDGTKKWYTCTTCKGVFCRDKLLAIWQISPYTYDKLIESNSIKDILNG